MKYKEELQNFKYQVQRRITKLEISSTKKNYETLIIKYEQQVRTFNDEGQTTIFKTLVMKNKEDLRNFKFQVETTITKVELSIRKRNS